MPFVRKPSSAADHMQGHGLNDLLRRTLFPGLPPTQCIGGYVFFPWGTGPTFPIFCDKDIALRSISGGSGAEFVEKASSAFITSVAEMAGVSTAEATKAIAEASGIAASRLAKMTVRDVAKAIFQKVQKKAKVKFVKPKATDTVGDYFTALSRVHTEIDADSAIKDLSKQTGLDVNELTRLPLNQLGSCLDMVGESYPGGSTVRSSGTTFCASGNGQVRCGVLTGWMEGAMWGGLIGGAIGGGVGAAIGALIGSIIGWLF